MQKSIFLLVLASPALTFAAFPRSDNKILESIIVTSQKRETALQDVPFYVGAATEQQIRSSGATNIADLSQRCLRLISISSISNVSKRYADRKAPYSAPGRRRAQCATSRGSRSLENSRAQAQ